MRVSSIFFLAIALSVTIPRVTVAAGAKGGGRGAGGRGGGRVTTGSAGRVSQGGITSSFGPRTIRRPYAVRSRRTGYGWTRAYLRRGFGSAGLFYVPMWSGLDDWSRSSVEPGGSIVAGRGIVPPPPTEPSSIQPLQLARLQPSASVTSGNLRTQGAPAGAQVYVDGFYVGMAEDLDRESAGLSLSAGWHRLELRAPGHSTVAANVVIEANKTHDYRANLQPLKR